MPPSVVRKYSSVHDKSSSSIAEKTLSNTQVSALNEIKNELKNILNILNRH